MSRNYHWLLMVTPRFLVNLDINNNYEPSFTVKSSLLAAYFFTLSLAVLIAFWCTFQYAYTVFMPMLLFSKVHPYKWISVFSPMGVPKYPVCGVV